MSKNILRFVFLKSVKRLFTWPCPTLLPVKCFGRKSAGTNIRNKLFFELPKPESHALECKQGWWKASRNAKGSIFWPHMTQPTNLLNSTYRRPVLFINISTHPSRACCKHSCLKASNLNETLKEPRDSPRFSGSPVHLHQNRSLQVDIDTKSHQTVHLIEWSNPVNETHCQNNPKTYELKGYNKIRRLTVSKRKVNNSKHRWKYMTKTSTTSPYK